MTTTFKVSGFSSPTTEKEVREFFSNTAEVQKVTEIKTGVEFSVICPNSAASALAALHGHSFRGDTLIVEKAGKTKPEEDSAKKSVGSISLVQSLINQLTPSEKQELLSSFLNDSKTEMSQLSNDQSDGVKYVRLEQPYLPVFSGEDKGDSNYALWRHEVKCLVDDPSVSNSSTWQCIRKSLKGMAAGELLTLGESPTISRLLSKFDALFGNTLSLEQLLQDFYLSKQESSQSLSSWGYKLELMMAKIKELGKFDSNTCSEMLKSKFWIGLHDENIKSALRHKFDQGQTFEQLLKYARSVQSDSAERCNRPLKGQNQQQTLNQLDQILTSLKTLECRVVAIEKNAKGEQSDTQKSIKCHYCGEPGHIRPKCLKLREDKLKQKKQDKH